MSVCPCPITWINKRANGQTAANRVRSIRQSLFVCLLVCPIRANGQTCRQTDTPIKDCQTDRADTDRLLQKSGCVCLSVCSLSSKTDQQRLKMDRYIDRQTNTRPSNKQDRHIDRQTNMRLSNKQDRHIDRLLQQTANQSVPVCLLVCPARQANSESNG